MKLEGIGKYPHVAVKLCSGKKATTVGEETKGGKGGDLECSSGVETVADFGEVAVGNVTKKRIEITNVSPVSI